MHTMFPTIPQDSPDYLGRLVISYSRVYTVVRTRQSYGRPELFIATPEGPPQYGVPRRSGQLRGPVSVRSAGQ